MKNRQKLNIIIPLIAAMFILSLFTGLAAAQSPKEQFEKDKEQYRVHKEKYENTQKQFNEAKKLFEKANARLKDTKDAKSREELKEITKEYIKRAIDHTIAYLQVLKSRVENSENRGAVPFNASETIDAHIAQLEQLKSKVQEATTVAELRDAHKELKDTWFKIRLETRYYLELILDHRLDQFIIKADNVSEKLDSAIEKMKAQNKSVAVLQEDAEEYRAKLAEAKAAQQQTDSLLASHSGFAADGTVTDNKAAAETVRLIDKSQKDTIKKLKSASKQLLDFVRDFRKLSGGKASIGRSGELETNNSAGATATATPAATATVNATATPIINATATVTGTATATPTATATVTETATPTATATANATVTVTATVTATATETPTPTATAGGNSS